MYEEFKQDSPIFRLEITTNEENLHKIGVIFNDWTNLAQIAYEKGQEYSYSINELLKSFTNHPHISALGSYTESFTEIKEMLSTLLACQEGFTYSLDKVFINSFKEFLDIKIQPLTLLKKTYEKTLKKIESLKFQSTQIKKSNYNKISSENHFIRLHACEKNWEKNRYDYSYLLTSVISSAQTLALEQFLSLVFTQ